MLVAETITSTTPGSVVGRAWKKKLWKDEKQPYPKTLHCWSILAKSKMNYCKLSVHRSNTPPKVLCCPIGHSLPPAESRSPQTICLRYTHLEPGSVRRCGAAANLPGADCHLIHSKSLNPRCILVPGVAAAWDLYHRWPPTMLDGLLPTVVVVTL